MDAVVEAVVALLKEIRGTPLFWVVVIPTGALAALWVWNQLRKQAVESGILTFAQRTTLYAQTRGWPYSKKWLTTPSLVPSPRSDKPRILWQVCLMIFGGLALFGLSIAILSVAITPSSSAMSDEVGAILTFIVMVIVALWTLIGLPFTALALLGDWLRNKRISKALRGMSVTVQRPDGTQVTLSEFFKESADDFLMGLDPRIAYLEDAPRALTTLETLLLVKPDKRQPEGQLAKRYYLTVTGATLRYRLQRESVRDESKLT